jgi:hypothetical protein
MNVPPAARTMPNVITGRCARLNVRSDRSQWKRRPENCLTRLPSQSETAEHLRAPTANSLPSRRRGRAGGAHGGRHARPRERAPRGHSGQQAGRCGETQWSRASAPLGSAPGTRRKTGNLGNLETWRPGAVRGDVRFPDLQVPRFPARRTPRDRFELDAKRPEATPGPLHCPAMGAVE